jgi:GNAT superfamily N-acetyltransferase
MTFFTQIKNKYRLELVEVASGGYESKHGRAYLKDGREIHLTIERWEVDKSRYPDEYSDVWLVRALLNDKVIGLAEFYQDWGSVEWVRVKERFRRIGVASALYDFIEKTFETKLSPSQGHIEDDGREFWKKRDPWSARRI